MRWTAVSSSSSGTGCSKPSARPAPARRPRTSPSPHGRGRRSGREGGLRAPGAAKLSRAAGRLVEAQEGGDDREVEEALLGFVVELHVATASMETAREAAEALVPDRPR